MKKFLSIFMALNIVVSTNICVADGPVSDTAQVKPKLSTGSKLGIGFGVPSGLLLIGVASFFLYKFITHQDEFGSDTAGAASGGEYLDEQIQLFEIKAMNALAEGYSGYDQYGNMNFKNSGIIGYSKNRQLQTDSLVQSYAQGAGITFANIDVEGCPKSVSLTYMCKSEAEKLFVHIQQVLTNKFLNDENSAYVRENITDDDFTRLYNGRSDRSYKRLFEFYRFFKGRLATCKNQKECCFLITEKKTDYYGYQTYSMRFVPMVENVD